MNEGNHYLDGTRRMQRMAKDEVKGLGEQIRRPTTTPPRSA